MTSDFHLTIQNGLDKRYRKKNVDDRALYG